jgi:nitrous oxidase accessory protein
MITSMHLIAALQGGLIMVGQGGDYRSIGEALDAAQPGDTILVDAGVYSEHLVLTKPVVLLGRNNPVIDGSGTGTVIEVRAPVTIRGFTIRGSGESQSEEHSGILADGSHGLVVEQNRLHDVLFGIYVKQSAAPVIRDNIVVGKDLPVPLRGDGIRLWYSNGGSIVGNDVERSRDVVIWFSDSTQIVDNTVSESRYGLHYMYSDHNEFEGNEFVSNEVGAFLMYSNDITFRNNLFADARGTTGRGLGFKDTDNVVAERNTILRNVVGVSIDNSPTTEGVLNRFDSNVIAFNDVAVALLPSVKSNQFIDNTFLDNVQPVRVTGGGTALANQWYGNYWSEYAGFDEDEDGYGDTPYVYERLSDDLLQKHERLKVFNLSLAAASIDALSRVLPFLQPSPVVIDSAPKWDRPELSGGASDASGRPLSALFMLGIATTAALVTVRLVRHS